MKIVDAPHGVIEFLGHERRAQAEGHRQEQTGDRQERSVGRFWLKGQHGRLGNGNIAQPLLPHRLINSCLLVGLGVLRDARGRERGFLLELLRLHVHFINPCQALRCGGPLRFLGLDQRIQQRILGDLRLALACGGGRAKLPGRCIKGICLGFSLRAVGIDIALKIIDSLEQREPLLSGIGDAGAIAELP